RDALTTWRVPDAAFGLIRATRLARLSPRERGLFRSTSIHDQTSGARRVARISEAHPGSPRWPDDLEGPGCGLRPYPGYASDFSVQRASTIKHRRHARSPDKRSASGVPAMA